MDVSENMAIETLSETPSRTAHQKMLGKIFLKTTKF